MPEHHSEPKTHPVPDDIARAAHIDRERFEALTRRAKEDEETFWNEIGQRLDWITPYSRIKDVSFDLDDLHIRWFDDGTLNVCANCVRLRFSGKVTTRTATSESPTANSTNASAASPMRSSSWESAREIASPPPCR